MWISLQSPSVFGKHCFLSRRADMLGNEETERALKENRFTTLLEPDQEVAAVLGSGPDYTQLSSPLKRPASQPLSGKDPSQEVTHSHLKCPIGYLEAEHELKEGGTADTAVQYPSLHFLAAQGEVARLKEEMEKGSDMNAFDTTGLTPLVWAAAHRQKATVHLLLKNGADATLCSPNGDTALSFAVCQGQMDVVELLLQYGADPNVANIDGGTPLMYASHNGHPQVVKLLLGHGADLTAKNNEGHNALSLSYGVGKKSVQRVLEDYLQSILEVG